MISIHCLLTHVVKWIRGKSACLVNRRSLVQIRAVPHFQIILWFIIMFTLFVFQNDFHPLSNFKSGSVAQRLKRLSSKQEISGSNPGSASNSYHTFVYNYVHQVYLSKMISIYCLRTSVMLWLSGKSSCLVNGRSLVEIRAVPYFHIILLFIIMFTKIICLK